MTDFILELKNITKFFPGVKALENVHFDLKKGEIHALMGENGAGKSTFIKIITGVHRPDAGEILFNGISVQMRTPADAQNLGIAAIYQHVTCYPHLSVAENMFIGHESVTGYFKRLDWKKMYAEADSWLARLNAPFNSRIRMGSLSVAAQQIVEIAKALSMNAKIIIMDEPTASLTQRESEDLYKITKSLREKGVSVIFISHRIQDIDHLADRITVFRDAKYIGTWHANEISHETLIQAMVGREITQIFPKRQIQIGETILEVKGLGRQGFFKDISFSVKKGEILALTGLVGSGRTEVCESIFGIYPFNEGSVLLSGKEVLFLHPCEAMSAGLGYLPEDRQRQGLVLNWDITKNISFSSLKAFSKLGWINEKKEQKTARNVLRTLSIKATSIFNKVSNLSGGNQQKVVVAKLLTNDLKVIIMDEPTKGVDVAAKTAIYNIMGDLVEAGYAIILISSEMPEVLGLSDRIMVMREGRIAAEFETGQADQNKILHAAMVKEPFDNE
ncbi:sugar ABC transporter ATP-binding protein [Treponema sp. OMZ 840]|uniref:sugar ABC transporter ATP-binding protein n=1 Tax=Treponema sp. OMZ 840 TaxID=244313 RepID=UPI003D8EFF52